MSHDNNKESKIIISSIEKFSMVLVGLINNIFFLLVMSSAQRIVSHFNKNGMVGMVYWSCTFCGLFASYINTVLSQCSVSYDIRFIVNTIFMGIGLLGCAISPTFLLSCISILFVGFSCNFGESVTIGYLAFIKKQELINFWGIVTGFAGILSSGYTVICIIWDFDYRLSFLILFPLVLIYLLCYFFVLRDKPTLINNKPLISEYFDSTINDEPLFSNNSIDIIDNNDCCECNLIKKILYYIITLDITYFAQYAVAGAFLDCAQSGERLKMKYLFPLLRLTQHMGVLIFASTRSFFSFPHLKTMTFIQMINFFIWLSQALLHWMPLWSEFFFIFLVGAIGGLSYVNSYDLILRDPELNDKEREVGSNIVAFSVTVSALISSGFTLYSEQTYLKPFVPKS